MEVVGAIPVQLVRHFEKAPGWFYLLLIVYGVLGYWDIPKQIDIAGVHFSAEAWAASLTLVLYRLGDAIDKAVFEPEQFPIPDREAMRERFGVIEGIYGVAMKIAEEAGQDEWEFVKQTLWIHILNELAKTFRSLILLVFAMVLMTWYHPFAIVFIMLAVRHWIMGRDVSLSKAEESPHS